MKETWATGPVELLRHAGSHFQLDSTFDSRIAFISIDNSVETSIKIFLSMPKSKSGINVPRAEVKEAEESFPKMVEVLFKHAEQKLSGVDAGDIEFYHRLRSQLYHNGPSLSVDRNHLVAYREIATILLRDLFGVVGSDLIKSKRTTLGDLILLWSDVEILLKQKMEEYGIDKGHTYKWEMLMEKGVLNIEDIKSLTDLRMIRNTQVLSTADKIVQKRIGLGIDIAQSLLSKLTT
jgi:hypothetical protein